MYDAFAREDFNLHAVLLFTINDFQAYGNLSGYAVKGSLACPICEKNTSFTRLKHGEKIVYLQHRIFTRRDSHYWRLRKPFNGLQELEGDLTSITGR